MLKNGGKGSYVVDKGGIYLLSPHILQAGKTYSVQAVCDFVASDPVYFDVVESGEEREILEAYSKRSFMGLRLSDVLKNGILLPVLQKNMYTSEYIAPKEYFTDAERSRQMMETIKAQVWKLDENGEPYPASVSVTVNKNLKNNYINVFNELFAIGFPIKSAGCYNYRNTHGGRLSEHALGTAIDINPDENCCVYSDGEKVGSVYLPYKNPYSVTPEVVNIFKKYGFCWGGEWTGTVDHMHFSYFDS